MAQPAKSLTRRCRRVWPRLLRQLDESGLSKLIVEIVLLGSVESVTQDETDALIAAAKTASRGYGEGAHRPSRAEFAAKQAKVAAKQKKAVQSKSAKVAAAA